MVFQKQPKRTLRTIIREIVERTNTDNSRIRVLEQENDILKSRMDTIEQALMNNRKAIERDLAELKGTLDKSGRRSDQTDSMLKELARDMKRLASSAKIKELETMVDMYNPLKSQFITREEVERLIERRLEK